MARSAFYTMAFLIWLISSAAPLSACPDIDGFIDFNCDMDLRTTCTGDSIVAGRLENRRTTGGYVKKLGKLFPGANFINLGVPGITSTRLLRDLKQNLGRGKPVTTRKTKNLDMLCIDVGRNDFWDGVSPSLVARNINRIKKFLIEELGAGDKIAPLVIIATLIPNTRSFQRGFINSVNRQIMRRFNRGELLRFDKLKSRFISSDGLHPTRQGYAKMAKIASKFLTGKAQELLAAERTDTDGDTLYDTCELKQTGTDPVLADTDTDTFSDGEEVCQAGTDPLDAMSLPPGP